MVFRQAIPQLLNSPLVFLTYISRSHAEGINNIKGLKVDLASVETNIVSILSTEALEPGIWLHFHQGILMKKVFQFA